VPVVHLPQRQSVTFVLRRGSYLYIRSPPRVTRIPHGSHRSEGGRETWCAITWKAEGRAAHQVVVVLAPDLAEGESVIK
jgi:hypothetical protein